jgi:hypothetical protein
VSICRVQTAAGGNIILVHYRFHRCTVTALEALDISTAWERFDVSEGLWIQTVI